MENSNSFSVREANITDYDAAYRIYHSAYPNDYYNYAKNIGRYGVVNLVAVKENLVIGFISVLVDPPSPLGQHLWQRMRPYIGYVGVDENSKRLGIARALIEEAAREALVITNERFIYLECESENEKALNLYKKLGFEVMLPEDVEIRFNWERHSPNWNVLRAPRKKFGVFDL